jgi:hypothetical protein
MCDGTDPDRYATWIKKVEDVAETSSMDPKEIARMKADGGLHHQLVGMYRHYSWENMKQELDQIFHSTPTAIHAATHAITRTQRPDESLQDYIVRYTGYIEKTAKQTPRQLKDNVSIQCFIRNLYNREIKKFVCGSNKVYNLEDAMRVAQGKALQMKQFEGLVDTDSAQILGIEHQVDNSPPYHPDMDSLEYRDYLQSQINVVDANSGVSSQFPSATPHPSQPPWRNGGNTNWKRNATNAPRANNNAWKANVTCYKCGVVGHISTDPICACNQPGATNSTAQPFRPFNRAGFINTVPDSTKLSQSITSETELNAGIWQELLNQLAQAKKDNVFLKDHARKAYQRGPNPYRSPWQQTAVNQPSNAVPNQLNNVADTGLSLVPGPVLTPVLSVPKIIQSGTVTQINADTLVQREHSPSQEMDPESLCHLDLLLQEPENYSDQLGLEQHVLHVRLSQHPTVADFPVNIAGVRTTGLFDTGASVSCLSTNLYNSIKEERFQQQMPLPPLSSSYAVRVTGATGSPLKAIGLTTLEVDFGTKGFAQNFIVCEALSKPLILGIDFARSHSVGMDWDERGQMFLYTQGRKKLAEMITPSPYSPAAIFQISTDDRTRFWAANNVEIPPRNIALLPMKSNLVDTRPRKVHYGFSIEPNQLLAQQ